MRRLPRRLVRGPLAAALVATAVLAVPTAAQDPAPSGEDASLDSLAMEWIGLLQRERFDSAAAGIAPAVSEQLNAEALGSGWQQVTAQFGALESLEPGSRATQGGFDVVNLRGTFDGQVLTVRVVYDGVRDVAGFFVLPAGPGGPPAASPGGPGAAER